MTGPRARNGKSFPPNDPVTAPADNPSPAKGFLAAYRRGQMAAQPPGTTPQPTDPALVNAAFNTAFNEAARHRSGSPERLAAAWAAEALLRSGTFDGARRRLHRDVADPGVRDAALAVLAELEQLGDATEETRP